MLLQITSSFLPTHFVVLAQALYILLTGAMTVLVARSLARNGRVFLIDAFDQNVALADAINQLLVVGFYVINMGWVLVQLEAYEQAETVPALIKVYAARAGAVFMLLGALHLFNIYVFNRYRRAAIERKTFVASPPVLPSRTLTDPAPAAPASV